jgi:hypothetical protein
VCVQGIVACRNKTNQIAIESGFREFGKQIATEKQYPPERVKEQLDDIVKGVVGYDVLLPRFEQYNAKSIVLSTNFSQRPKNNETRESNLIQ